MSIFTDLLQGNDKKTNVVLKILKQLDKTEISLEICAISLIIKEMQIFKWLLSIYQFLRKTKANIKKVWKNKHTFIILLSGSCHWDDRSGAVW